MEEENLELQNEIESNTQKTQEANERAMELLDKLDAVDNKLHYELPHAEILL
jgi:hypothetical protein